MIPEEGINAIARLCIALKAIGIRVQSDQFYCRRRSGRTRTPSASLARAQDAPSGKLKFNVGKIDLGRWNSSRSIPASR